MKNVDELLTKRGQVHGDFTDHARITQNLKNVMAFEPSYRDLTDVARESLEMIQHKIGRILAGDPNHQDHWDDIAGYARLVSQRLAPSAPPSIRESELSRAVARELGHAPRDLDAD